MPLTPQFKDLTKTDRRKQWKLLKSKHSSAISKAKLDFDLKLGSALDKYQIQVDKLTQLAATTELNSNQIEPVLVTTRPLKTIVDSYHDKVKTLPDPAKKELTGLLAAIDADIHSWGQLAVTLQSATPSGPTNAQKAAAHALQIPLDNIRSMALTVVTRGERAKVSYEKGTPNPRPGAAALAGHMVETARLAGPSAHELANAATQVVAGSNYELLKKRATAVAGLVQRFRDAAHEFRTAWDFNSDVNTISADFDAQALKSNYDQIIEYCDGVLALIHKLP